MRTLLLMLLIGMMPPAWAEAVQLRLTATHMARAEFRQGKADQPAVLLLHGFLQTLDAPTIHRLTESLNEAGYSVLAPTLTLGISDRHESLACEAIHMHTMAGDVGEIDAWLDWLRHKPSHGVILVGHSFGSVQALAYLSAHTREPIRKFIGISLVEARLNSDEAGRQALLRTLRQRLSHADKDIVVQQFSYCQNLRATPAALLSYLEWSPDRIIRTINALSTPTAVIMGSRDDRLGPGWIARLGKSHAHVIVIEGANHFIDGEHEFDLHDRLIEEIRRP